MAKGREETFGDARVFYILIMVAVGYISISGRSSNIT
jgi:hypothetical protein